MYFTAWFGLLRSEPRAFLIYLAALSRQLQFKASDATDFEAFFHRIFLVAFEAAAFSSVQKRQRRADDELLKFSDANCGPEAFGFRKTKVLVRFRTEKVFW